MLRWLKNRMLEYRYVGFVQRIPYFIAQRILRINADASWPVHWSSVVFFPENIKRKSFRPYLGFMPGQYIQAMNGIEIGYNVRLGPGVKIISANHDLSDYSKHLPSSPIIIGDNCWIAADAIILSGVTLGDYVVVAAGAVVTSSFDGGVVIGGNPARIIKKLGAYKGNMQAW